MELKQRFINARRQWIERQYSKLNQQQREAVLATEGPLLLLAGAGSGKTTVLIHRIVNLIRFGSGSDTDCVPEYLGQEDVEYLELALTQNADAEDIRACALCAHHPVAPWNILAITFTNKAANEMKTRLASILGTEANDIWAMTFHSACCRILRRNIDRMGFDRSFTIYDTSDSERVIKDILQDLNLDSKSFPPKLILSIISKAKDRMQLPEQFSESATTSGDFRMEKIAEIYQDYQHRLKAANAVDFDDIILLTVLLLQQNEDVRNYYRRKFRYVLVDEYQDTNHMQYLLVSLLVNESQNICVVGDDDQSIYRFRGATIENILNFEQQFRNTRLIRLEQNYRSTQSILNAANAVISHNHGRKGKKLWTQNGNGAPVVLYEAMNERDESDFVTSRIFSMGKGKNFHDFAILYRTNAQSNVLEYALKRQAIPYRIIGGMSFFERAEIKDMLAYLCVINNPFDDLRLNRIINTPPRGIGAKTMEMATRLAQSADVPLYQIIKDAASYPALEKAVRKLKQFSEIIESCIQLKEQLPLPDFYEEVMQRSGYVTALQQKNDIESRTRLENIQELKSSLISYTEQTTEPSLNGFLEEISLYTDLEQYDPDADSVVLMTIHSSKGLEFPHVFLVGVEEGLFPSMRATDDVDEMEEERRLCYVAMTRAKQTLTISYAQQRMLYGRTTAKRRSRFIDEIPPQIINHDLNSSRQPTRAPRLHKTEAHSASAKRTVNKTPFPASNPRAAVQYQQGEMVEHKVFGRGMILSVLKMAGDSMLEIAFDQVGTKKLMANYASQYMKKL